MLRPVNSSSALSKSRSMPWPPSTLERQAQLRTSLSTSTPSQSKMMRSLVIIVSGPQQMRAYTQPVSNNPQQSTRVNAHCLELSGVTKPQHAIEAGVQTPFDCAALGALGARRWRLHHAVRDVRVKR